MRRTLRAGLAVTLLLAAGALAAVTAGGAGVLAVGILAYATLLFAVRLRLPPGPPAPEPRPRPALRVENAGFPAYRRLEAALGWTEVSPRHFDGAVRPVLRDLAADRLAARRGIRLADEPARARDALGDDAWALLDPARPASTDTEPPGVPLRRVEALADRLEQL